MDKQKPKKRVIRATEITIDVNSPYLDIDDIFRVIKEIEKEEGFLGFTRFVWEVDMYPQITYITDKYKKDEKTKKEKNKTK